MSQIKVVLDAPDSRTKYHVEALVSVATANKITRLVIDAIQEPDAKIAFTIGPVQTK